MKSNLSRCFALLVLLTACSAPPPLTEEDATESLITLAPEDGRCGDGICDGPETADRCPQDCSGSYGMHTAVPFSGRCGDGICEGPETQDNCAQDCEALSSEIVDLRHQFVSEVDQSAFYFGDDRDCWDRDVGRTSTSQAFTETISPDTGSADTPLLFAIVVHVEPHDEYTEMGKYNTDRERLLRIAEMVVAHSGVMTVQFQTPFTRTAQAEQDPVLSELAAMGHEIALHFHEQVHLKGEVETLPVSDWVSAMAAQIDLIEDLSGATVTTWSGGNTYSELWQAAAQAGLSYDTNYKVPYTQLSDEGFGVVNPWRPAGGNTIDERLAHDPEGPIIYLPSGVYPVHCENLEQVPTPYSYESFDYVTRALRASLESAVPGRINVFYITFHPGDFLNDDDDLQDYEIWEQWLTQIIDPLVADGRVVWASVSEMGIEFEAWEQQHAP